MKRNRGAGLTGEAPASRPHRRAFFYASLGSLTVIFLVLTIGSIVSGHKALTYDEPQHFRYGELIYQLESDRFDDSKMPFSVLNVLVSKGAERLAGGRLGNEWQVMSIGRLATIFTSLALGFLCLIWASRLGNRWVGVTALGLYVFEPNIIAHSRLITTDLYAAATVTLTLFLFWHFQMKPAVFRGVLAGLALGLSQIAKYSGLLLYPTLLVLAVLHHRDWLVCQVRTRSYRAIWRAAPSVLKYGLLLLVTSLLVINAGFLFNGTLTPLAGYTFKSDFFQSIQRLAGPLRDLPLPTPYPYLEGLDFVMFRERTGDGYGEIYLLGELREAKGFPGYFLVASLFKVPLAIWIFFILALFSWFRSSEDRAFRRDASYLLVPALIYAIYLNFFFRAQIGIRFFLVCFPLLLIFSALPARNWQSFSNSRRTAYIALGLYLVASVASYYPHYLSYFNELVPDRKQAYQILADSNLDWGQNRAELEDFLKDHPDYIFEPSQPTTGVVVVGVNELTGVLKDAGDFQWLQDSFEPSGHFAYTYLIYEISEADLEKAPD